MEMEMEMGMEMEMEMEMVDCLSGKLSVTLMMMKERAGGDCVSLIMWDTLWDEISSFVFYQNLGFA